MAKSDLHYKSFVRKPTTSREVLEATATLPTLIEELACTGPQRLLSICNQGFRGREDVSLSRIHDAAHHLSPPGMRQIVRQCDLHFDTRFVTALIVMLLKGTLVPFIVAPPNVQVTPPSETVLDCSAGGGWGRAVCVSGLHPGTKSGSVHASMYVIFICVVTVWPNGKRGGAGPVLPKGERNSPCRLHSRPLWLGSWSSSHLFHPGQLYSSRFRL